MMTLKKLFLTILISAVFSVLPFKALAASCDLPNCAEYITYGGYDVIEKAFSSIALIFSDNRTGALVSGTYAVLYFSLFIIGVVFFFTNGKFAALKKHFESKQAEWTQTSERFAAVQAEAAQAKDRLPSVPTRMGPPGTLRRPSCARAAPRTRPRSQRERA